MNADDPRFRIFQPGQREYFTLQGQGAPDEFMDYAKLLRDTVGQLGLKPGPLEALWWSADGGAVSPDHVDAWRWTVMLELPRDVSSSELRHAAPDLRISLQTLNEGEVVQSEYAGSLRDKDPRLEAMLEFAIGQGYEAYGKYHEIYLDDPGPESPPGARTLLRWPVRKNNGITVAPTTE